MDSFLESVQETVTQLAASIPVLETGAWKQLINEDGLLAYISKSGNTRSQFIVNDSLSRLHAFLKDYTTVSSWDPSFVEHEFVLPVDAKTHIDRRCFNFSGKYPIDFVYFTKEIVEQDVSVILLGQSIEPPGVPTSMPGYSRGELVNYTFILRKISENQTKVTVVYGVELKEALPEDVGEALTQEDLRVAKRMSEAIKTWTPYTGAEVLKTKALALEAASISWEVLYNEDGVRGVRSPDRNSVISQGEVPASVPEVLAYLQNQSRAKEWVLFFHTHAVLRTVDPQTKVHHRLIQTPDGNAFEFVFYTKQFTLDDGTVILVGKSIDTEYVKPHPHSIRGEFLNHSFILRKVSDTSTKLTVLYHIDPKVILPEEVLKGIQTEDSKAVARIKGKIGDGGESLVDAGMREGRNAVLDTVNNYQNWERLVGDNSVLCYRSDDHKTVACVCEVPSSLDSVTGFLTDYSSPPKWVSGFESQHLLGYLDPQTSLNQRFSKIPNLPEIEVVFATRQFAEADGSVTIVSRTIPDLPEAPAAKPGNVSIGFQNYSFALQRVGEEKTKVVFVVNVDHPFVLPDDVLKTIQSEDSKTLAHLRDCLAAWRREDRVSEVMEAGRGELVQAWENYRWWEKLAEEGGVQGFRSEDCKNVVSIGKVAGGLCAVKAFLTDEGQFPRWIGGLKSQRLLATIDSRTTLNHRLSQVPNLPEIEVVFATREFHESNGSVLLVSRSIPHFPGAPKAKQGNASIEYVNYSFYLRSVTCEETEVMLVININHPFQLPAEVLKQIQTGESLYVGQIREKFASWVKEDWNAEMDAGRIELISSRTNHQSWEKLAEDGSVQGFRSTDTKTVLSTGEVLGSINAVKLFLLDTEQLAKWVAGMKEQKLMKYLDARTTLNHRALEIPNLPRLEVVFATREYTEEDGSVLLVSRSSKKLTRGMKTEEGNVGVEYVQFSFYLRKVEEMKTEVTVVVDINHPFQFPPEVLKQIQTGDSLYVKSISEHFTKWGKADHLSVPLSSARADLLSAYQAHSTWEKLSEDGSVKGFRSTDCKTVISIGAVSGPLCQVTRFLKDGKQLAGWVNGLKEQRVVGLLDAHTTLNHRLLEIPNLPAIEVSFATREYKESDGSRVLVSKSIPGLPGLPKAKEGCVEIQYVNFSFYLRRLTEVTTEVMLVINIKHSFQLPEEVLKQIQTGESMYVKTINEKFTAWDRKDMLSISLDEGRIEAVEAVDKHSSWEKLYDDGIFHGYRSPDYKTVLSLGEVSGSLTAVKSFLTDPKQLTRWVAGSLHPQEVLSYFDVTTTINQRFLQLPGLPRLEVVFATREYQEEDGSVVIVSRTVTDFPVSRVVNEGDVRVEYRNFSFWVRKVAKGKTQVAVVVNISHPFVFPAEVLKEVQTGDAKYVKAIELTFATWLRGEFTPALSFGRAQVLDAYLSHSTWEKLAEDGSVSGFRSSDWKTVVSIGHVDGCLCAVKAFLTDASQSQRWINGLKEQKQLASLDAKTTLNHRLNQVPNLPDIEVVFATREYRQADGSVLLISATVPECEGAPKPKEGNVGVEYVNFSYYLKRLSDEKTEVMLVINIKHPFDLPAEVLKAIQTGESLYVKSINEKFASWEHPDIAAPLALSLASLIEAWQNHESWEVLSEFATVQGYRSSDCKTVVSIGDVNGDLPTLQAFLLSSDELAKWIGGLKSQRTLEHLDSKSRLSHRLNEVPNLPGIEVVFVTKTFKLEDGSVALVSRSVPELAVGPRPKTGNVAVEYLNYSFYLQTVSETKTRVMLAININHPFKLPDEVIKTIQTAESMSVKHLREKFTAFKLSRSLDSGRADVLSAYESYITWEKLVEDGSVKGFRSTDWKTVVSIGEVPASLSALKAFLLSPDQLQRWIAGLKEQVVLNYLDGNTTLNHRFLVAPNLPEIEVVFATREYTEEDSSVVLVSRTVAGLPGVPPVKEGSVRVEYVSYSFLLKRLSNDVTEVMLIININHPFQLPAEVLKQIQTGESLYVNQIAEKFASWNRSDLSSYLDAGRADVLDAQKHYKSWEKLAEDNWTEGYRSTDAKTVISLGQVDGNISAVKRFLKTPTQLTKWISGLKEQKLLTHLDAKTTLNHRLLEAPNLPGIEVVFATREYTEDDGSVLLVSRTVPDLPESPLVKEGNAEIQYLNYSFYLRSISQKSTQVLLVVNINHPFQLPAEVLKQIQTGESLYVKAINEKFGSWVRSDLTSNIDAAKGQVLDALHNHEHWEKLAAEGTVSGYRSNSWKTVVSIGEVPASLCVVKKFLSDASQFPRWIAGLKEHTLIAQLDSKTTLNHRLVQIPNLPNIEVAFVTREFTEDDGSVVLVSTSIPHLAGAPKAKEGSVSVAYVNYSFHLKRLSSDVTRVMLAININHPLQLPAEVLKQIQTGESLYVNQIAEKLASWDRPEVALILDTGRNAILEAFKGYSGWEKLAEDGSVQGYRSADCKNVLSIGEVNGDISSIKAFFKDPTQLAKWINGLKEQKQLTYLDARTTLNHRLLEVPNLPGIEVVFATREYTEDDGSVLLISRSVPNLPDVPKAKPGNVCVEYVQFSFYLRKVDEAKTQVMLVININHPFQLPPEVLKQIQTGESLYVKSINEKFAVLNLPAHLDSSRVQILDALYNHSRWEKLAEDGSVSGFRSSDWKTVVSIGHVDGCLCAVKAFLADASQSQRWINGLKEQKQLAKLDAKTTLNHRLNQVPNLPDIEVVFVTKECNQADGSVLLISKTVSGFPGSPAAKTGNVGVEYVNFSYYLKRLSEEKTEVMLVINIKHPFDLPAEVLKAIQTGESLYVKSINEKFASWENSAISASLSTGRADVLAAWKSHQSWEKLAEAGWTQGFRSTDCKTVISIGDIDGSVCAVKAFLRDATKMPRWIAGLKEQTLVSHLDAKTVLNHRVLEAPNLPGIEVVFATREYREEHGNVMLVSKSVDKVEGAPEVKKGNTAIKYLSYSFYLHRETDCRTKVMLVINVDHPFQLPPEALKKIQTGESMMVNIIADKFANWIRADLSESMDSAKSEVLDALQNYEKWEKLAAEGTVSGYRSNDWKTVVSIGEVPANLCVVKKFLSDASQFPRWIAGLKEHTLIAQLDSKTTLNHRLVQIPNLPNIEVVFVTREFTEDDGSVVLVSTSIPHLAGAPKAKEGSVSVAYVNYSFHLKRLSSDVTRVMLVININHPLQLPAEDLKQIQTGESLYVNQIAEKFASWNRSDLSSYLDAGRADVLDAQKNYKSWEKLAEDNWTEGYRSTDAKTVISLGQVDGNISAVKRFLKDPTQLTKWINGLKEQKLLTHLDAKTTLNHRLLEVPNLPGIEVVFATREYTEDDGSVLLVSRTVPDHSIKEQFGNASVQYVSFSFYLRSLSPISTQVQLTININHPFQLPASVLKQIQTGESLYVTAIASAFSSYERSDLNASLDLAKSHVTSTIETHQNWEKLAEAGSVHGYRSSDWKTVLSLGPVHASLPVVKSFLTDTSQLPRWISGLKSQQIVGYLDAKTTLNHRLLDAPNLPGIEVVFATREYTEDDGSVLVVSTSIPHLSGAPKAKDGNVEVQYVNYSFHLRKETWGITQVAVVINIAHPFKLPPEALKMIQTGESMYVALIDEKVASWERLELNSHLDAAHSDLLSAVAAHTTWEKLSEEGVFEGFRSSDNKTVLSLGEIDGRICAVKCFLRDPVHLASWIAGLKQQKLVAQIDAKTTLNHRLLEVPNLAMIEAVFAMREYKENDGGAAIVNRSVPNLPEAPKVREGHVEIRYMNFSFYLQPLPDTKTKLALAINIDHPFQLPAEALKSIQTGESLYAKTIAAKFGEWIRADISPALDEGRKEVLEALQGYAGWEKLAGEGAVQGFRSADCKTVVSVGEVGASVGTLKTILTDREKLQSWLPGLKEQRFLFCLDSRTRYNQRFIQLPNLPEVEVVFATREYRQEDGSVILVSKSLAGLQETPKTKPGNVSISYLNHSIYLRSISATESHVMLVINIIHPFDLPPEVLKAVQTRESLLVGSLSQLVAK